MSTAPELTQLSQTVWRTSLFCELFSFFLPGWTDFLDNNHFKASSVVSSQVCTLYTRTVMQLLGCPSLMQPKGINISDRTEMGCSEGKKTQDLCCLSTRRSSVVPGQGTSSTFGHRCASRKPQCTLAGSHVPLKSSVFMLCKHSFALHKGHCIFYGERIWIIW